MTKHIKTVVAFAVFAASALANQAGELDLQVPFAFKAGSSTLPAGTYRVTEPMAGFILIRGEKGGVFVPAGSLVLDTEGTGKTSFKFDRAGDKYVLQAVHIAK